MKNFIENILSKKNSNIYNQIKNIHSDCKNFNLSHNEKSPNKKLQNNPHEDLYLSFHSSDNFLKEEENEIIHLRNENKIQLENEFFPSDKNIQPLIKESIEPSFEKEKTEYINKKFRRCKFCLLIKVR
jgi:hypothetical protein